MSELNYTSPPTAPCPFCKAVSFLVNEQNTINYFQDLILTCPKCKEPIDWWKLLLRQLSWGVPSFTFAPIGANTTTFIITMQPSKVFVLDLESEGVPPEAKVLHVSYTPQGNGLFPLELHGNAVHRISIPHKIYLYGRPFGEPTDETRVAVAVVWVHNSAYDTSLDNLVLAFEGFANQNYESIIIPANVAIEAKLGQILSIYLKKFVPEERVKDFLQNAATYSYQLNILLPLITKVNLLPQLPDNIRGLLNSLRKLRNDLAHGGKLPRPLTKSKAIELICASVFGYEYCKLIEQELRARS